MGIATGRRCFILIGPEDVQQVRQSAAGQAPRLDYRELAGLVKGTIIEGAPPPAQFKVTKPLAVLRSTIPNFRLALRLLRQAEEGSVILSTGETWGLPVAVAMRTASRRGIRHFVYVHRVFSRNWRRFLRIFGPCLAVDGWICVTSKQRIALREVLGEDAVIEVVSQGVDTRFFSPERAGNTYAAQAPYILAVGAEMRDYALLIEAVGGRDLPVMIRASSRWMAGERRRIAEVPPNVTLVEERLSFRQLRDLYAGAAVVVVPLVNTLQAAGITTILEAMAMCKRVIATQSDGLPDVLVHRETGIVVPASASDLAKAIGESVQSENKDMTMVEQARALMEEESLENYARKVAEVICAEQRP